MSFPVDIYLLLGIERARILNGLQSGSYIGNANDLFA